MVEVLGVIALLGWAFAWVQSARARVWKERSQHWFSVSMGEKPLMNEGQACRLMADLFPKGVPSITREVASQKAWRERRALTSSDHTTRHGVDALPNEPINDSFAARQIMGLCIGEREVDE
jgi:hypothetical protein